jgi:hypothetical protein
MAPKITASPVKIVTASWLLASTSFLLLVLSSGSEAGGGGRGAAADMAWDRWAATETAAYQNSLVDPGGAVRLTRLVGLMSSGRRIN